MGEFFDAAKALFPQSRAFELFVANNTYRLVHALCELPEDIRREAEMIYFDLFPETTRYSEKWEKAFALIFYQQEQAKRQQVLASMWRLRCGGQSAQFLQGILRCIDSRIQVIENTPLSNPRHSNIVNICVFGRRGTACGNRKAVCAYRIGNINFEPTIIQNDVSATYDAILNNPDYWWGCFYVCKDVVRNALNQILFVETLALSNIWRNYIEYIVLKIKPVHSTAIVFIDWQNT